MEQEEQSNERKARLAALRKNRGKKKDEIVQDQQQPQPQTTPEQIEEHHEPHFPTEQKIVDVPSLNLTKSGETVEAISQSLQDSILRKAQKEAGDLNFNLDTQPQHNSYTNDLKQDIASYLAAAKADTDKAIHSIMQTRFEEKH